MRVLQVLSGIAVLLLVPHFVHVLHHFFAEMPHDSPLFWAGIAVGVAVEVLAFIGGCLLIRRSR